MQKMTKKFVLHLEEKTEWILEKECRKWLENYKKGKKNRKGE